MEHNIKLSSVELEAFRGFRDKVIFDFTLSDGNIADLIAIYAPNGFGKTSFFDGVEWNIKGTIERFEGNSKIKNAAKDAGGCILKNTESALDKGTVSLIDANKLFFSRHTSTSDNCDLLAGTRNNKSTSPIKNISKFNENKKIEILPQSRIDSFLSSTTPEEKYDALLDFWGGNDDSSYYVGVSKLLAHNEKEINILEDGIRELVKEITTLSSSEDKVALFNQLVFEINSYGLKWGAIKEITSHTTETEFESTIVDLNGKIASIAAWINAEVLKQERLAGLQRTFLSFEENVQRAASSRLNIFALEKKLLDIKQLNAKRSERTGIENRIRQTIEELKIAKEINSLKSFFSLIVKNITILNNEKKELTEQIFTQTKKKMKLKQRRHYL